MSSPAAPPAGRYAHGRYPVVSADCHVVEPADLWEERIDHVFRERLPRLEVDSQGRKWMHREGHRPRQLFDFMLEGEDLDRSQAGSRDPHARLLDHARD